MCTNINDTGCVLVEPPGRAWRNSRRDITPPMWRVARRHGPGGPLRCARSAFGSPNGRLTRRTVEKSAMLALTADFRPNTGHVGRPRWEPRSCNLAAGSAGVRDLGRGLTALRCSLTLLRAGSGRFRMPVPASALASDCGRRGRRPACRSVRPTARLRRRHREQAHLPTQQPTSRQDARLPGADAHPRRAGDHRRSSS